MERQGHAQQSFKNVDDALQEYHNLFGVDLKRTLEPEPSLADYYTPSDQTKTAEIIEITLGMALTTYIAYKVGQHN